VAGVAGFIAEIQSTLSDEAFQTFKKGLGVYKDVSCPNHCSCISGSQLNMSDLALNLSFLFWDYIRFTILSFGCRIMTFIHSLKN